MDILNMIPSKDMKECLIRRNYHFSEEETLAFLYHRSNSVPELFGYLKEFLDECTNPEISQIVTSYIKDVEEENRRFRNNELTDGRIFRCVIYYEDDSEKGQIYSYDYDIAYQFGKSYQEPFTIQKIDITMKELRKGEEPEIEEHQYNEKGEQICSSAAAPEIFDTIIHAPHPFMTGDVVRVVSGRDLGTEAVVNGMDTEYPMQDYGDFVLFAESYDESLKEFYHFHPCPFDVELCETDSHGKNMEMLQYASKLLRKEEVSLENFTMLLHSDKKR